MKSLQYQGLYGILVYGKSHMTLSTIFSNRGSRMSSLQQATIVEVKIDMANKADLVDKVADKTGLTKKDSNAAVEAVFDSIQEFLAEEEKVQLIGFGTFEVRERAARKGRNPQTGEEIQIPATKVPAFKAGKNLKEAVKE